MRVCISGAGIAGLSLAASLRYRLSQLPPSSLPTLTTVTNNPKQTEAAANTTTRHSLMVLDAAKEPPTKTHSASGLFLSPSSLDALGRMGIPFDRVLKQGIHFPCHNPLFLNFFSFCVCLSLSLCVLCHKGWAVALDKFVVCDQAGKVYGETELAPAENSKMPFVGISHLSLLNVRTRCVLSLSPCVCVCVCTVRVCC